MNEKDAKQIAFEKLSSIDNVRIVSFGECKMLGFNPEYDLWEVNTEILLNDQIFPITLYIYFSTFFPIEIPRIFLSTDTYDNIKYIPHIDNKKFVCTFDNEIIRLDPEQPFEILYECLNRAKRIISDGLHKVNFDDFLSEYKAYWEEKYDDETKPIHILSLIDNLNINDELKLISLENSLNGYKYILFREDNISTTFKGFLTENHFKYQVISAFQLDDFPLKKPPFNFTNKQILEIVRNDCNSQLEKFELFINKNEFPKLIITKKVINGKEYIFGWFHKFLNTNRKGYRDGSISRLMVFNTFQAKDHIERVSSETFTPKRLENRTAGDNLSKKYHFAIAGTGSIGSNLLFFLNSFNLPTFSLIDDDFLKIENINRHFLGFSYINKFKTLALKEFLKTSNPFQEVNTKEESISKVITFEPEFINSCDYFFSCIGNFNIESWIFEALKNQIIKIPIFFIWVEPYLVGGHCLFIHPNNPSFNKYFEDGFFISNIIPKEVYNDPKFNLTKREAGCQTTFIPYSSSNVISFLSQLFSKICSIMEVKSNVSTSFSWIGNIQKLNELELPKSKFAENAESGQLIEVTL
jgi:hypothetical protein